MGIWLDGLWMVDGIAGSVHWGAIWQVPHIVDVFQVRIRILGVGKKMKNILVKASYH